MFKLLFFAQVILHISYVRAHGDHAKEEADGAAWQYAQRHMATEHHIDTFDPKSFFLLHDLNRDGILDREEIEAIYGVHHVYSQKQSKDAQAHQEKADRIVDTVLGIMDKDKDGKISLDEFEAAGVNALPNFEGLGAEGHHYDVESEFFLHHEEMYHNTPETQTDEAYNHPEDIEHFAQHEQIEREEAEREAKFQGITVEEALASHEHAEEAVPAPPSDHGPDHPPSDADGHVANPYFEDSEAAPSLHPHEEQLQGEGQVPIGEPPSQSKPSNPKVTRVTPPEMQDPSERYKNARKDSQEHGAWGSGEGGYKRPSSASERMRKNVPYKYKFRRNWGDF